MKSLLVGLDTTPASKAAVEFSFALASRFGARLTGISVLDIAYLTAQQPIPLGGAEYKFKADFARVERAHAQALELRKEFLTKYQSEGAVGRVVLLQGSPADRVRASAAVHDAIVIGRDTDFHGQASGGDDTSLEQILKGNPRPVIVTPETINHLSRVLIAYDGSTPAARRPAAFRFTGACSRLRNSRCVGRRRCGRRPNSNTASRGVSWPLWLCLQPECRGFDRRPSRRRYQVRFAHGGRSRRYGGVRSSRLARGAVWFLHEAPFVGMSGLSVHLSLR